MNTEMIVVDNHSRDGSAEMMKRRFPGVRLIGNQINTGYAHAVNQAIEKASGDFLLILNPDTVILTGALERTVRFMLDHDDVGIVGCKILNPDHSLQSSCRSFPSLSAFFYENAYLDKIFPRSKVFGKPYMSYFSYDSVMPVDVVLGAFMMIRREAVRRIGGFDERFFMYAEETDYCYRAKSAGWSVYYYPGASIVHVGGESTKQESLKMFIELHKSHHRFIAKYHGSSYLFAVKLILFLGLCIRFEAHLLGLIFSVVRSRPASGSMNALRKYGSNLCWYAGRDAGSSRGKADE
jgi:GT2 family glycosyltransferase